MTSPSEPGQAEQETPRAKPERKGPTFSRHAVVLTLVLGGCVVLVLASHFLSRLKPFSWIPDPFGLRTEVRTLATLLALEGVEDKEELLAALYSGEVIVSAADLESRMRAELMCVAVGGTIADPAPDNLFRWLLSRHHLMPFEHALHDFKNEIERRKKDASRPEEVPWVPEQVVDDWLPALEGEGRKLVYLVRGSVKVWYDIGEVLEHSACRDADKNVLDPCDLNRTSSLALALDGARRITTTINPYFSYHEETLGEDWSYGWVALKGDVTGVDLLTLRALRILGHEELRSAAIGHGMYELADSSLRNTIQQMVRIFHDRSITVDAMKHGEGAATAPATDGCIRPYEKIPIEAGTPRKCGGSSRPDQDMRMAWDGYRGSAITIEPVPKGTEPEKGQGHSPCWELELGSSYELREVTIWKGDSSLKGVQLEVFNGEEAAPPKLTVSRDDPHPEVLLSEP
jgi:hypothetical protein